MSKSHTSRKTLVLMYHAVWPTEEAWSRQRAAGRWYAITENQFSAQMEYLASEGYRTASLDEFLAGQAPSRSVVITFDDGHFTNLTVATPVLQRFGFRATFFVTVASTSERPDAMTWDQLKELQAQGMSIQSHGYHHLPMVEMSDGALVHDLCESKRLLETQLGIPVKHLSVPGGFADSRVYRHALDAGYESIATSEPGVAEPGTIIRRIAIVHSNSDREFARIVQQKPWLIWQLRFKRQLGIAARSVMGMNSYERIKRFALRKAPTSVSR